MKEPCVANLDTARKLLEHGVLGEGATVLVELRRCAADCGCDDWQSCDDTVQGAWHEATHKPLPEARPKPEHLHPDCTCDDNRRPAAVSQGFGALALTPDLG